MIATSILMASVIFTAPLDSNGFTKYINRQRQEEQSRVKIIEPKKPKSEHKEYVDLGAFEVTAYAEDEITASGTVPQPYYTVAVDPTVIPIGTKLYIKDLDLHVVAEDTGGAVQGNIIDLFVGGSEEGTDSFGRQTHEIYLEK